MMEPYRGYAPPAAGMYVLLPAAKWQYDDALREYGDKKYLVHFVGIIDSDVKIRKNLRTYDVRMGDTKKKKHAMSEEWVLGWYIQRQIPLDKNTNIVKAYEGDGELLLDFTWPGNTEFPEPQQPKPKFKQSTSSQPGPAYDEGR